MTFSLFLLYIDFFLHTGRKISYLSSRAISGQSELWNWEVLSFPVVAKREGVLYLGQPFLHLLLQMKPHFFQVGHFKSIFHPTAREHMFKWTPLCHLYSWIPSTVFYACRLKSKSVTVTCYLQTQLHLQSIIYQTRNPLPDPDIFLTLSPTLASVPNRTDLSLHGPSSKKLLLVARASWLGIPVTFQHLILFA